MTWFTFWSVVCLPSGCLLHMEKLFVFFPSLDKLFDTHLNQFDSWILLCLRWFFQAWIVIYTFVPILRQSISCHYSSCFCSLKKLQSSAELLCEFSSFCGLWLIESSSLLVVWYDNLTSLLILQYVDNSIVGYYLGVSNGLILQSCVVFPQTLYFYFALNIC